MTYRFSIFIFIRMTLGSGFATAAHRIDVAYFGRNTVDFRAVIRPPDLTSLLTACQQRRIDYYGYYPGFGIPFSGVSPFPLMTKFYNRTPVLCARMCAARTGICDERK